MKKEIHTDLELSCSPKIHKAEYLGPFSFFFSLHVIWLIYCFLFFIFIEI